MQILFYDHVGLDIFALDDDLVIEIKPLLGAFGFLCDIVFIAMIYPLYMLELDDRSAQTVYSPLPVLALMQSLLGDAYAGICAFYDIDRVNSAAEKLAVHSPAREYDNGAVIVIADLFYPGPDTLGCHIWEGQPGI